ncbi:MAG: NAD(+) diphosphatase [Alphaproteobacteria bacterium]|nr:NAD(+) diphosphatase [Alphaproteobacteria bacterium]
MEHAPNVYASGGIDRASHRRTDEAWLARRLADPTTRVVPVWQDKNLAAGRGAASAAVLLTGAAGQEILRLGAAPIFLGLIDGDAYFAVDLSALEQPPIELVMNVAPEPDVGFVDLRQIGPLLSHEDGALLAYARAMCHWNARHGYCAVCGTASESTDAGHVRRCPNPECRASQFPRTDPAVIMLVTDGDRVVLGRQKIWPPGMHSVLAGFVEPGESLEDGVRREVLEEVGVELREVRYRYSQPWPFPQSLMLGFVATCDPGARLFVNLDELENADWYSRTALRASPEDQSFRLPRLDSIARRLLLDWLEDG